MKAAYCTEKNILKKIKKKFVFMKTLYILAVPISRKE